MSEDQLQAQFFQRCWMELPETRRCFFSVPNGSSRDIREATKLKATGLIAGEPDMILIWNGKAFGFELKSQTGVLSSKQKEVHKAWREQNTDVFIVKDVQTGLDVIHSIVSGAPLERFSHLLSCLP